MRLALALLISLPALAQTPAQPTPGASLFLAHCAHCHGLKGEGGRGSSLVVRPLPRAANREALFWVILRGIPNTEMPPARTLTQSEATQLVYYVESLGRSFDETPGNPLLGAKSYEKGKCSDCHSIKGRGGQLGPDLTDIGLRRGIAYLRAALIAPGTAAPEGFLQVRVKTREGKQITGVRLSEDTFSIRLRDESHKLYSFFKNELAELEPQPGASPMPSFEKTFTPQEITDLVAYLASRRGN
ncbi:MAG: c-type cytochrome [Bryobacteraceae bacterium]